MQFSRQQGKHFTPQAAALLELLYLWFAFKFIVCFHTKVCVFKAGEKFGNSKKCIQRKRMRKYCQRVRKVQPEVLSCHRFLLYTLVRLSMKCSDFSESQGNSWFVPTESGPSSESVLYSVSFLLVKICGTPLSD